MTTESLESPPIAVPVDGPSRSISNATPSWSERYGQRHRLVRIADFPAGIAGPRRVRLYWRHDHYVLQWWDPAARANLSDRVDGDLVAAIARARQLEERLDHARDAGLGRRRLGHRELVEAFLDDLGRRADAGQIDPGTVRRYAAALAHYTAFAEQPAIARATPHAAGVDRAFQLAFAAFLADRRVAPNGRPGAPSRPMRGGAFVEDAARALFAWAADPGRGHLLPAGFRNPFLGRARGRRGPAGDPFGEPDVTAAMAVALLEACDAFQLPLFAPLVLFGLRAAEPCYLFREHLEGGWLRVPCLPELGYQTKGRRDKRFPLVRGLGALYDAGPAAGRAGLLLLRRGVAEGRERPPLLGAALPELVEEYRRRCVAARSPDAARKSRLRDEVLRDAGGLRYDHIEGEFSGLARRLGWPAAATLKDFRHLFCTGLENAGVPEHYRRYLMGHAPGRAAIASYTHLNRLREKYEDALRREWPGLLDVVARRAGKLGLFSPPPTGPQSE
jgi:integrase